MAVSNRLDYHLYKSLDGGYMMRFLWMALFVTVLGLVSAGAYQRGPQRELNPEGQPEGFKAGVNHRYFVWHDREGWHLRTTTARERHRFHGEVVPDEGSIQDLRTFRRERGDWVTLGPNGSKVLFDLSTDEGLDGFDFRSNAQTLRFRLLMDGKERPELIFVGLTGNNPPAVPFAITNPEGKPKPPPPLLIVGKPEGMGPGSAHRFMIWQNRAGVWQLRTTTAGEMHNFSGEIEAEGGRFFDLKTEETERRDWVNLDQARQNRITFMLVTKGAIDGFSFRTDAKNLKFKLILDGEARPKQVYIGPTGANPTSVPFTLPAK
jgi:hypothetical protein